MSRRRQEPKRLSQKNSGAQTTVTVQTPRRGFFLGAGMIRPAGRTKCSLSNFGFRASGVRTGTSADRAETGLLPRFLSSVPNRQSQEVRRERVSRERFSVFSASGQSTGLSLKPQETCHSVRRPVRRRARLAWELAVRVGLEPKMRQQFSAPSSIPWGIHFTNSCCVAA